MPDTGRLAAAVRRFGRRMRHLSDEDLLALIESAMSDAHLDGCERCATRHAELLGLIAELDVLHAEADAAFDEKRLLHQRTHILRRLDRNNGPARVLPFPAAAETEHGIRMIGTSGRRWVAAAAIGGLLVGIFSGRLLTHRSGSDPDVLSASKGTALRRPVSAIVQADLRTPAGDEILLEEVETALSRPRVSELRAIDDITPAAR